MMIGTLRAAVKILSVVCLWRLRHFLLVGLRGMPCKSRSMLRKEGSPPTELRWKASSVSVGTFAEALAAMGKIGLDRGRHHRSTSWPGRPVNVDPVILRKLLLRAG